MKPDIEAYYQKYLTLVKKNEELMGPVEKIEIKQAFMAGLTHSLVIFSRELPDMPEREAMEFITSFDLQLQQWWADRVAQAKNDAFKL